MFNESNTQMPQNSAFWAFIRMLYISRMVKVEEACGMLRRAQVMLALVKQQLLSFLAAHFRAVQEIIMAHCILLVLLWGEMKEQEMQFSNLLKTRCNVVMGSMVVLILIWLWKAFDRGCCEITTVV